MRVLNLEEVRHIDGSSLRPYWGYKGDIEPHLPIRIAQRVRTGAGPFDIGTIMIDLTPEEAHAFADYIQARVPRPLDSYEKEYGRDPYEHMD